MRLKPLLILTSCLLLSVLVGTAVSADDRFVSSGGVGASAEAVENYWTKERMENAVPYPMHSPAEGTPRLFSPGTIPPPADGEPGLSTGGLPGLRGALSSRDLDPSELLPVFKHLDNGLTVGNHGYPFPFPFTRFEVLKKLIKTYPYKTIGKVFFTQGASNFVCSGSSIGGRAVLTAGHCVSDGFGNWHTNWMFRPAYYDGKSKGKWTANQLWTFTVWHENGEWCRDVGFAIMRDKSGRTLSSKVGWLGFAWNWDSEHMHWNMFGYPVERTRTDPEFFYSGERMIQCQASFAEWTAVWWDQQCTPLPQCAGCDMTGGASGGPWIWQFEPGVAGATNYANSVNSTYYLEDRVAGGFCGPYFDDAVRDFKDAMVLE